MSAETPLERILRTRAQADSHEPGSTLEWLRRNGGTRPTGRWTLATTAARVAAGEDFAFAVREFLDGLYVMFTDEHREALVRDRPATLPDRRHDAYLAALAEHFAAVHRFPRPDWSVEPGRFLDHYWWVSAYRGFWPTAVAESPAAFRRRGVLIDESMLQRL